LNEKIYAITDVLAVNESALGNVYFYPFNKTMKDLPKLVESQTRVRFQDCDPYQHLNNSKYLDYFLNAREDQLALYYDLDIYKMAREKNIAWVVGQHQIAYLRPAFFMELVSIQTQLIRYSEKSVLVEMRMYNESKTELQALLWTSFVHFHIGKKSTEKHSEELMALFAAVHMPIPEENFDARTLYFRKLGPS
jgi:acyl-CoA thioester hydrolase